MKCSTPTPFPFFGGFHQHTHRGLLRLAAQVYSHKVNNSKAFFCEDGSVISFLATLKFFNSSLAFSAPFSLSGGFSEHTQRGSRGYLLMGINSRASSIVDSLFLQDLHDYVAEQESTRKLAILDST